MCRLGSDAHHVLDTYLLVDRDWVNVPVPVGPNPTAGASQLPRLATGRAAVTNGYSHRTFCWRNAGAGVTIGYSDDALARWHRRSLPQCDDAT